MSSLQQSTSADQCSIARHLRQDLEVGDMVMIVRSKTPQFLGLIGTIVGRSADSLSPRDSEHDRSEKLARDWDIELASGPMTVFRKDGRIVTTARICSSARTLMRLSNPNVAVTEDSTEEVAA